jgi:DNA invertase Pin-like site-specific DNA recombinase
MEAHDKVNAEHLKRDAYLYIRQSSLKQVFENTESTRRQYAMRERAIGLGWSPEQVVVIDSDQGESAAPGAADREGFEKLVTDVGMGRAGIVMGLEVSRLARSSSAWHRLLDICAVTDTLVLDQDGLYDTKQINDRLLLGLKAAMSEAELHLIRERMRGGALSKASRGELRVRLPVGFLYDVQGRVVLDPDKQVRESLSLFFKTFARLGSAYKTARFFHEQGLSFPKRIHCGPGKGDLIWTPLTHGRVVQALNCPRYAGAYAYGRSKTSSGPRGLSIKRDLPVEQWHTLILDAHEGYISWQDYQRHRKQLEGNAQGSLQNRKCPPREGPALLQGLVVCGLCGRAMSVRYYTVQFSIKSGR